MTRANPGATQTLRPNYEHRAPCPRPGRLPRAASPQVGRTPGISCEAVPASMLAGAGMRGHLRLSAACGARVGAAESFVSFIPLFDGVPRSVSQPVWPTLTFRSATWTHATPADRPATRPCMGRNPRKRNTQGACGHGRLAMPSGPARQGRARTHDDASAQSKASLGQPRREDAPWSPRPRTNSAAWRYATNSAGPRSVRPVVRCADLPRPSNTGDKLRSGARVRS